MKIKRTRALLIRWDECTIFFQRFSRRSTGRRRGKLSVVSFYAPTYGIAHRKIFLLKPQQGINTAEKIPGSASEHHFDRRERPPTQTINRSRAKWSTRKNMRRPKVGKSMRARYLSMTVSPVLNTKTRSGFARLLTHLKHINVIVMSEPSRLGRDMLRNAYHVGEILESGVLIFYYLTDEEEKADTPEQKIILTLKSYASEVERQKASQRSRDALLRKAQKGYNTGGRVYGYDNIPVYGTGEDGQQIKLYTDYRINEREAEIVRGIFTMYADGHGHAMIAKTLNGDPNYQCPSLLYFAGQRPPSPWEGTGSWGSSSVREMLYRERYTGLVPFGRHRKAWRRGTKVRLKQDTFSKAIRQDLEIVAPPLWQGVQTRLKSVRTVYLNDNQGKPGGRPKGGASSKYLLSGLARCSCCGGSIVASGDPYGPVKTAAESRITYAPIITAAVRLSAKITIKNMSTAWTMRCWKVSSRQFSTPTQSNISLNDLFELSRNDTNEALTAGASWRQSIGG